MKHYVFITLLLILLQSNAQNEKLDNYPKLCIGDNNNELRFQKNYLFRYDYKGNNILLDSVNFRVYALAKLNDSTIWLWDGRQYYNFSIRNKKAEKCELINPIDDFLKYPIKSIKIMSGNLHLTSFIRLQYNVLNDSLLSTDITYSDFHENNLNFKNKLKIPEITKLLQKINHHPIQKINIKDFEISEQNKINFVRQYYNLECKKRKKKECDALAYFETHFPVDLVKINDSILNEIIITNQSNGWYMGDYFTIKLKNENNDSLEFNRTPYYYNVDELVLELNYHNKKSIVIDLDLIRFIKNALPPRTEFYAIKQMEENAFLSNSYKITGYDNTKILRLIEEYYSKKKE